MTFGNSSLTGVVLTSSSGTYTNVFIHGTQRIDIQGLALGRNSVIINHPGIIKGLGSGVTTNHSLKLEYADELSVVDFPGTSFTYFPQQNPPQINPLDPILGQSCPEGTHYSWFRAQCIPFP
jgi:hypothetical protein